MKQLIIRYTAVLVLLSAFVALPISNLFAEETEKPNYNDILYHHIGNANEFHLFGDVTIPLPCILYSKECGLTVCMSSDFEEGAKMIDGYVLDHGIVRRVAGLSCTKGTSALATVGHETHDDHHGHDSHNGHDHHDGEHKEEATHDAHADAHYIGHGEDEEGDSYSYVTIDGHQYKLEKASTLLSGTSWYDLSISKNVVSMIFVVLMMFLIFIPISRAYKKTAGQAPKGMQSFFEPIFIFLRDEVAKPAIGEKYEKYFPFLLSIFFFILFANLLGLIPLLGGPNITGNVGTTAALALFTFLVTNLSGNKHYWGHIFWMPGVPFAIKPVLAVIEFAGLFIKPFTLLVRLFANITGGHIIILSLVGLIWLLGDYAEAATGGTIGGAVIAVPFIFAMNFLELFVAFLQAFIFALLSALYIGAAVEDHHHDEEHAHAH